MIGLVGRISTEVRLVGLPSCVELSENESHKNVTISFIKLNTKNHGEQ